MPAFPPVAAVTQGDSPLVAAAIHDGHAVQPEVEAIMAIDEAQRLREEDPFTAAWTTIAPTRVVGLRSRFEVDLNRPREGCMYLTPQEAWGLIVWNRTPTASIVNQSRAMHEAFYSRMRDLLDGQVHRHGRFVVLDLHSYNHRRAGPTAPPADPTGNPQINVGTGDMPRNRWEALVDRFIGDLRACELDGRPLDVRENVRFHGGYFARWIHQTYPTTGCVLSIEVKKTFMDEWTGEAFADVIDSLSRSLGSAVPGLLDSLACMEPS